MKKQAAAGLLLLTFFLLFFLPCAQAETRQGVISLEGMEETIEETLFESPSGFSFWYPNQRLEAFFDKAGSVEGVYVGSLYSDDGMTLSVISGKDAEEYAEELGQSIVKMAAGSRVQIDVYRELENGRYYFLTLIAENGQYLSAVGDYSEEAAEGTAKILQHVLDSVAFISGYDTGLRKELPGRWAEEYGGVETVLLLDENGEVFLDFSSADGRFSYTGSWSLESSLAFSDQLTLLFTQTDNPLYSGSEYSVECVYAAYTESWIENDTQITYLLLNPPLSCSGVSPFEDVYGSNDAAVHREQGPNMRVVKCKEFVSLREERSTASKRLAKIPLGALVLAFPEYGEKDGFIYCVYQDEEGYVLAEYLQPIQ